MDYPYTKYIPLELEIQPHTLSFYERASCINGMLTRQSHPAARRKMRSWRLEAQRCQKSYGNLGYFWLFFMEEIMEILGIQRNHGRNVDLLFFFRLGSDFSLLIPMNFLWSRVPSSAEVCRFVWKWVPLDPGE